jgi:ferric-dicitrate binding protein FerR (iron transport regulator)
MNKQKEPVLQNLLDDDRFLRWLLHPTEELDEYWMAMSAKDTGIRKAIAEINVIFEGLAVCESGLSEEDRNALWKQIEAKIESQSRKKNRLLFFRYAAAVAAVIAVGISVYLGYSDSSGRFDFSLFISEKQAVETASGNIVIILDNQEKIEVRDKEVELVHDAEGRMSLNAQIIHRTTGEKEPSKEKSKGLKVNQLHVPYGKTSSIVMSDGTKIWVNSGSRIVYPTAFAADKREIYVEGEVYLEVVKNDKAPFFVKTDRLEMAVLGTAFNVSAYKNDETQTIVLVNGSVAIKDAASKIKATLRPNELFSYDKNANSARIEEVNVLDHVCWKYGFFVFKNKSLTDVLKKVERYYNVQIDYSQLDDNHTCLSGKLDLKDSVEETFRTISIAAPVYYEIDGDKIIISTNPQK